MKVYIRLEEWYPVATYRKADRDDCIEVPDELLSRYDAAIAAFEAVEEELRALLR